MRLISALLLFILVAVPARANDSVAELSTGGLQLARSDAISIDSEELFVAMDRIEVDYVFTNRSSADIETIVAFPMPDIELRFDEMPAIPRESDDNFLGFSVTHDGKPVAVNLQQQAYAAGVEVTELLRQAGIPIFAVSQEAQAKLDGLDQEMREELLARGAVTVISYDNDGSGMKDHVVPSWTIKSAYWWRARFPAGQPINVSHRYTPSLGGSAGLFFVEPGIEGDAFVAGYRKKYCMDDGFVAAVKRRVKASAKSAIHYSEARLSYILSTGANWYGPIRKFRLRVDKGSTDNLVSFCGNGVRKIAPTVFEMTIDDFYPEKELDVLFVVGWRQ